VTPEGVGRVVAAVAQGELEFSTGAVIHVVGGLALGRLCVIVEEMHRVQPNWR